MARPEHNAIPSSAPASRRPISILAAVAVLALGLALSVGGWRNAEQLTERLARERFEARATEISMAIGDRLSTYEMALRGGQAMFAAMGQVSRGQWRDYVGKLNELQNYPGIQGIGYAQVVRPENLDRHQRTIRAQGFPDYAIRPEGPRGIYTAIIYLEPFDWRNQRAFGYDMFSEPVRRAAMERARDTGNSIASGKVTLMQETDKAVQAGFLLYLPCYAPKTPVFTVEERRAALHGYVYSPFRMNNLMRGIMGMSIPGLGLEIYDGDAPSDDSLMFRSEAQEAQRAANHHPLFESRRSFFVFERPWTLVIQSLPDFEAGVDRTVPRMVLLGGISISLLLAVIAHSLLATRAKALSLAEAMTVELRESEEKTRLILESTGEPIYGIDTKGLCTFCNPASLRALGYSRPEDLLGRNMHQLIHHSHADGSPFEAKDCRIFQAFQQGQGTHVNDEVFWRADGTSFPAEYWSYPQKRDGLTTGAAVVFQDITERKRNAALLAQERQRLTNILEGTNVGTWEWNIPSGEVVFNERWAQIVGYSLTELAPVSIGTWTALAHPDDLKRSGELLERHFSGELAYYDFECRMRHKDGSWVWVHDRGKVAAWTADGKPLVMSGTHQDITERIKAEEALRESRALLSSVLDSAVDPIFTADAQGRILTANPAASVTFGYALDELAGQKINVIMPEPFRSEHDQYLRRYTSTGNPHVIGKGGREVRGQRKDGTIIPFDISVSEFLNHGERQFTGILRDISERVRDRESLEAAHAELAARQKIVDADLEAAAKIQRSLLPQQGACSLGIEADFHFRPSTIIGGDIFNLVCLGPEHTGLYMVDVSGHGVPAALVSFSVAQELSPAGNVLTDRLLDEPRRPDDVLRLLDSAFPMERFDKFFSMFYLVYEPRSGKLTYCNAGHPPPMLLRDGGSVEFLEEGGTLVGLGFGDAYAQGEVTVSDGDTLLVYTDGVTELENPEGGQFSPERLEALFQNSRNASPEQVLQDVTGKLLAHADGRPPDDDISLICVRFNKT